MEIYNKLKQLILDMEKDIEKIYLKNQSHASIRTRHTLQEIRILSKELRQDIQEQQKQSKNNRNG